MNKVGLAGAAMVLALGVLGIVAPRAYAAGQTCVWEGTGGDNLFSTTTNWSGCNDDVPQDDDTINFPYANVTDNQVITNDIATTAFSGITITGGPSGQNGKAIAVTALKMADGATLGMSYLTGGLAGVYVYVGSSTSYLDMGPVTGAGALTLMNYVSYKNVIIPGALNVPAYQQYTYTAGDDYSTLVIEPEGVAGFDATSTSNTFDKPIVLKGGDNASLSFGGDCKTASMYGCSEYNPTTWTVSGPVTVNAASLIDITANTTVKFTGAVSDKSLLSYGLNNHGSFQFGVIAEVQPITTVKFEGENASQPASILTNQIGILTGTRQLVTVYGGGVLKGTGIVTNQIYISAGGIVAPGNSPGCLTSDRLSLIGEYQFELGGSVACTSYDQLDVKNASNSVGAVIIDDTSAVLTTSRYEGYTPKQGDVFVIINQAGDKAVSGTFMGLPEGATFTQNDIVFKISYVGGDGNDVTLTVQNSPTAPDTGVAILKANPLLIGAATVVLAILFVSIAKISKQRR